MTDYSSVFFDFANLKRPMIFYMYDLDDYKNNLRDFYLDLDELPGPITKNEEELEEAIKNIDEISKKYKEKYEKFNKKFTINLLKSSSKKLLGNRYIISKFFTF